MKIVKLSEDRIKEAAELYITVFSNEPWNDEFESYEEVENFIKVFMSSDTYLSFLALENDEVIGICLGLKKPWIKGMEYYIDEFCIKSDLQGKGYGSQFLSAIEKEINLLGMYNMILNTEKGFASETFYIKNGFRQLSDLIVLGK
jgi:GNAT superfamily N-acetyltransferase